MEDLEKLMVRMMESRIASSEFSKITLKTNPVKLDGPESHNLEEFISGTAKRPEGDVIAVRQWNSNNSRVVAWLLASMVPSVAHTVEALTNTYELWQAVVTTYSYKEYVGELKRLWNDFDFYSPFTPTHPDDVDVFRKWIERQCLVDFLDGLNPEFEYRRSSILSTQEWPTLDEAISLVLSEKTRLATMSSSMNTAIRSALVVQPTTLESSSPINSTQETQPRPRGVKICDHCHKSGHIKAYCYELHGRPTRDRGRGGGRSGRGRGQYNQAHFSSMEDLSVEEMQLLEKFRSGVNISESSTSTEDSSNQPTSSLYQDNFTQISSDDQIHALNCSNFSPWVVDSGASNHMTGSFRDFVSYIPYSGRDKVRLADSSFTPISGKESIKCTSELSLSSVLHVSRFSINLLSISAITNDLDCAVTFFKAHCVFQEPRIGRKFGTGIMRNGLYYLEGGVSGGYSETSLTVSSSQKEDLLLQHRRLGHLSFTLLACMFLTIFESYNKEKLVCDACELAKHTRSAYPGSGLRSKAMFEFLWGEAVLTAAYLINRMPLRTLDYKTPLECLQGTNSFIIPPKVFGCVCFVRDHRPSVGKLDARALKCIFVGYSSTQKGYKCWCPNEQKLFISMDVIFRESEPFYISSVSSSSPVTSETGREGEFSGGSPITVDVGTNGGYDTRGEFIINGGSDTQEEFISINASSDTQEEASKIASKTLSQPATQPATSVSSNSSPLSETIMHSPVSRSSSPVLTVSSSTTNGNSSVPPIHFTLDNDDLMFLLLYVNILVMLSFIASLSSVSIPKNWKVAKEDPKWKAAMLEEMRALEKNNTWELVSLPADKQTMRCKWIFTVKQTPEGDDSEEIAHLKAQLAQAFEVKDFGYL
ncbi:uncharacterized protein [Elaeis guineensis]|uniref:uncharacterized protein n=1 Tax=Elaeis guineensis var. tenera TaxID=51953 RepID=UPI003C6D76D0